jgi:hypothetical protein
VLSTFLLLDNRLKIFGIFRANGNKDFFEKIKHHLTLGDYGILEVSDIKDNHILEVAMLLKTILAEFTEPVCPIPVFEEFLFPKINELMSSDTSDEKKMDFVIELLVN